jgi:hypothetical protein
MAEDLTDEEMAIYQAIMNEHNSLIIPVKKEQSILGEIYDACLAEYISNNTITNETIKIFKEDKDKILEQLHGLPNEKAGEYISNLFSKHRKYDENPLLDELEMLCEENILPMITSHTSLYVKTKIRDNEIICLLDTGAEDNVIDPELAHKLGLTEYIDTRKASLMMGVGKNLTSGKIMYLDIEIGGDIFPLCFTVMDMAIKKNHPIIGLPFMMFYKIKLDFDLRKMWIMGKEYEFIIMEH